jgi:hypothetical protein
MSYDFFVFPAEAADGVEEARTVYETARERGALTPGGPMARFLDVLNAASPMTSGDGFLAVEAGGHDGAAYVCTSWDDPMRNLATVAGLARPHGLSVYDVQLDALYDPRGARDVVLTTEAGPRLPYLTRTVLHDVVSHLLDGHYHWLNAERGDQTYVQAYLDGATFDVEHRAGGPDRHFGATTADAALVEDLVWSWAVDDDRWRTLLDFRRIEV